MRHSVFITIHCLILRQAVRVWVILSDSETHCLRAEMSGLNTSLYVRPLDNWHPKAMPLKLVTRLQVVCDPTNTLHYHAVCTSARNALFIKLEQRNNFGYIWFDDTFNLSGCASGCGFSERSCRRVVFWASWLPGTTNFVWAGSPAWSATQQESHWQHEQAAASAFADTSTCNRQMLATEESYGCCDATAQAFPCWVARCCALE